MYWKLSWRCRKSIKIQFISIIMRDTRRKRSDRSCTTGQSNISCHSTNMEEINEAHSAGLSVGKYRAYLELKELDPSVTIDDIRDLSMREIRDLINSYDSKDTESDDTGNSAKENTGSDGITNQKRHHGYGRGRHKEEN